MKKSKTRKVAVVIPAYTDSTITAFPMLEQSDITTNMKMILYELCVLKHRNRE